MQLYLPGRSFPARPSERWEEQHGYPATMFRRVVSWRVLGLPRGDARVQASAKTRVYDVCAQCNRRSRRGLQHKRQRGNIMQPPEHFSSTTACGHGHEWRVAEWSAFVMKGTECRIPRDLKGCHCTQEAEGGMAGPGGSMFFGTMGACQCWSCVVLDAFGGQFNSRAGRRASSRVLPARRSREHARVVETMPNIYFLCLASAALSSLSYMHPPCDGLG